MIQFNTSNSGRTVAPEAASNRWGDLSAEPTQRGQTEQANHPQSGWTATNVGSLERTVSVAAGSILALSGLARRSAPGAIVALIGGAMLHRGITGHCYAYQAFDIDTANEDGSSQRSIEETYQRGVTIETAMLINRPAEQLYAFWRDFTNLPKIMSHLESVTMLDGSTGRRSHWVAKAPMVVGGRVEWDAELTADEPNRRIAWQSVGTNTVDSAGEVRFEKAPGDRGTEVHVRMVYVPPAGDSDISSRRCSARTPSASSVKTSATSSASWRSAKSPRSSASRMGTAREGGASTPSRRGNRFFPEPAGGGHAASTG